MTVATCHLTLFGCCLAQNAGSTYYYYTHYARPLPKDNVYTMTIDYNMHVASLKHHKELDSKAAQAAPNHYTVIKLLKDKLDILDNGCGDWENEVEEGMGYIL